MARLAPGIVPSAPAHHEPVMVGPAGEFQVHDPDDDAWSSVLAEVRDHDFYHLPGYHRFAQRRGEGRAHLFTYREAGFLIGLPLLLRPVEAHEPEGLLDATSVYGYAGPITSHASMPRHVVHAFQAELRRQLLDRRVVAVFSRLHPLMDQRHVLAGIGETEVVGKTVSVDLTLSPEDQWAGYRKSTRRIIRRAQDAGVICLHDRAWSYVHEWSTLYERSMRRVQAGPSYVFDATDFDGLLAELGPTVRLFVALLDGKVVAGGLYTICRGISQAHLGAMDWEYAVLSPTRLVDDAARRWACESGARVFHLGGGIGGREDSLFRYKAGFSDRRHDFEVWRWVVDDTAYRALCERSGGEHPDYFPGYRHPAG